MSRSVRFHLLSAPVLRALIDADLDSACRFSGMSLPAAFLQDGWLWNLRLGQIAENPDSAPWLVRATLRDDGVVVGRAGFHGPPDERGVVEIGYEVLPEHRRQGLGLATATALIEEAASNLDVTVVRASVSPDNESSLAIVRRLGFTQVGEQIDEIDGLELVFELPLEQRRSLR